MTQKEESEQWSYVLSKMKNEGFDYCFRHYSNFEEVDDDKFHQLRKAYLKSAEELESYILNKSKEL